MQESWTENKKGSSPSLRTELETALLNVPTMSGRRAKHLACLFAYLYA